MRGVRFLYAKQRGETRSLLRSLHTWLLTALLALSAGSGWGVSFDPKQFDQLVAEADQIFIGTAIAESSRKLPAGAIVTDVTFATSQVLKGNAGSAEVTLMVLGGSVGGETFSVPGIPLFRTGVTYLIFSQGSGTTIFPVVGGDQGMFQVRLNPDTGENLVFDSRGLPIVSPSVRQAMAKFSAAPPDILQTPQPIPLDVFVQAIRNRLGL